MGRQQIEVELHRLADSQLDELRNAVVRQDMERAIEATDDAVARLRQLDDVVKLRHSGASDGGGGNGQTDDCNRVGKASNPTAR
jgi:anti-sigma factor RsiW